MGPRGLNTRRNIWIALSEGLKDPDTGLVRGLFLGSASVAAIVYFGLGNNIDQADWGTIFSGIIQTVAALGAAWLAWFGVQRQIRAQEDLVAQQRRARLEAERAVLPMSLREIVDLAEARINHLITMEAALKVSQVDPSVVATLKACVEVSDGAAHQQLVDLIAVISFAVVSEQPETEAASYNASPLPVLLAKQDTQIAPGCHNRITAIFRWAAVRARASNLFLFAYGNQDQPDWPMIQASFAFSVRHLTDRGFDGGFALTNHDEYARRVANATNEKGYFLCRQDWRTEAFGLG